MARRAGLTVLAKQHPSQPCTPVRHLRKNYHETSQHHLQCPSTLKDANFGELLVGQLQGAGQHRPPVHLIRPSLTWSFAAVAQG